MGAPGRARGDDGGRVLVRLDASPSTNDEVRARWDADPAGRALPHLSSVVTTDQTAGRGRLGRDWSSPAGSGLAVSTILRLRDGESVRAALGLLPLAAALALRETAAAEIGGADGRALVKWPNDVLIDGRKTSGILGEVLGVRDGELACVVGTGVNVSLTEEELPVPTATSLAIAAGGPVDAERVLDRYLAGLTRRVDALVAHGADARASGLLDELERTSATLGRRVRVTLPGDDVLVGLARAVTAEGHLVVVDDAGGRHVVAAGDVERVRPEDAA